MWLGFIKALLGPTPSHLTTIGYYDELVGLGRRMQTHAAAWAPHLAETKSTILRAIAPFPAGGRALILGSGHLHDIPIDELARKFREVVLVDILHLAEVRWRLRERRNVRLVQRDVTGLARQIGKIGKRRRPAELPELRPTFWLEDGFDFVASVNLLGQLPVLPGNFLLREIPSISRTALDLFSRRVIEHHLDWLAAFACPVCVVTDIERLECDPDGAVVKRKDCLWGVTLPAGGREWLWEIAPRPIYAPQIDVRNRVAGFAKFPKRDWLELRASESHLTAAAISR
jgi:hypothetical protein